MCMYIHTHTCMYICICIYIYIYIYLCVDVYVYIHTYLFPRLTIVPAWYCLIGEYRYIYLSISVYLSLSLSIYICIYPSTPPPPPPLALSLCLLGERALFCPWSFWSLSHTSTLSLALYSPCRQPPPLPLYTISWYWPPRLDMYELLAARSWTNLLEPTLVYVWVFLPKCHMVVEGGKGTGSEIVWTKIHLFWENKMIKKNVQNTRKCSLRCATNNTYSKFRGWRRWCSARPPAGGLTKKNPRCARIFFWRESRKNWCAPPNNCC